MSRNSVNKGANGAWSVRNSVLWLGSLMSNKMWVLLEALHARGAFIHHGCPPHEFSVSHGFLGTGTKRLSSRDLSIANKFAMIPHTPWSLEALVGPEQRAQLSGKSELKKLLSGQDQLRCDPLPEPGPLQISFCPQKEGGNPRAWTVVRGRKGAQWLPPEAGLLAGG